MREAGKAGKAGSHTHKQDRSIPTNNGRDDQPNLFHMSRTKKPNTIKIHTITPVLGGKCVSRCLGPGGTSMDGCSMGLVWWQKRLPGKTLKEKSPGYRNSRTPDRVQTDPPTPPKIGGQHRHIKPNQREKQKPIDHQPLNHRPYRLQPTQTN